MIKSGLAYEELTHEIIRAFYYVYNRLGPGFLESVYAEAMERVLTRWGYKVAREVRVPIHLDGEIIKWQRIDMIVEDNVIVENKAGEAFPKEGVVQMYDYVCATTLEVALMLFFGNKPKVVRRSKRNSDKRLANPFDPSVSAVSSLKKPL